MADKKISQLNEYLTPAEGDYLAVVDTANGETKKIDFINFKGEKGEKGDKGDTGATGATGVTGPQGIQGVKGDKGDQGIQGEKGDKGDTGLTGATGPSGFDGADGLDGEDAFVYVAYASDNSGTGFSLTPSASLKYIAVKSTNTEIPSPSASEFTGLWTKYIGDDGAGSGDMLASVYDPTSKNADAFDMDNMAEGADTKIMTATEREKLADQSGVNTGDQDLSSKLDVSLKGSANGLAELDSVGKVPSAQLPSFVDDILEYANLAAFPATGETGKIYVALDTNLTYRWSGSAYVEISASLALGETSSTAYRGDRGKTAYDHSQASGNPHSATQDNIPDGSTYKQYSSSEKTKLAGIASGATANSKATGAELDTGTDDAKFATAKAIKDSHNVPSVAPGTSGNVLTSNGTDWTSAAPSASGGDWTELANVTLASGATSLASGTITAKQHIRIIIHVVGLAGSDSIRINFNSDTGGNYGYRDFSAFSTTNAISDWSYLPLTASTTSTSIMCVIDIFNKSDVRKPVIISSAVCGANAAAPNSYDVKGVWNNTSAQITSISMSTSSQNMGAGTRMLVYGSKS